MRQQIAEIPVKDAADAAEMVRDWSNNKVCQIGMHTLRGNLTPVEAGTALANIAEASIDAVLQAVVEDGADRDPRPGEGGIAAVIFGDLASREVAPRTPLEILFVYKGDSASHHEALCRRFLEALHILTRASLLLEPAPRDFHGRSAYALDDFLLYCQVASTGEILDLTRARWIFTNGDPGIGQRFDDARYSVLIDGPARDALLQEFRVGTDNRSGTGYSLVACMQQGLRDVERAARLLQLTHLAQMPGSLITSNATSIFQAGLVLEAISGEVAEQLIRATLMWRNLHGIRQLVMVDDTPVESMTNKVKMTIARSCGQADLDQLVEAVSEAVAATESGLAALVSREG